MPEDLFCDWSNKKVHGTNAVCHQQGRWFGIMMPGTAIPAGKCRDPYQNASTVGARYLREHNMTNLDRGVWRWRPTMPDPVRCSNMVAFRLAKPTAITSGSFGAIKTRSVFNW
jgi:hypothetical protein